MRVGGLLHKLMAAFFGEWTEAPRCVIRWLAGSMYGAVVGMDLIDGWTTEKEAILVIGDWVGTGGLVTSRHSVHSEQTKDVEINYWHNV